MYEYEFTSKARKQLKRLDKKLQKRIVDKLDYCCVDNPRLYARKLIDAKLESFRLRVGSYRVTFDIESGNKLVVIAVGDRKEIYK